MISDKITPCIATLPITTEITKIILLEISKIAVPPGGSEQNVYK
jgi:hypothetical protein